MRSTAFAMAAVSSVAALVGFAGVANASATIDLIWIDVTDTACTNDGRRDCPQLGTTIPSVVVTDNITLAVIVTAGPGGLAGAGVSVDYTDTLPVLSVSAFSRLSTTEPLPYLPSNLGDPNNDTPGWVQNINAVCCFGLGGIGLPVGATAYLGTVTFHKDLIVNGTFEIVVGIDGPDGTDGVLGLDPFADISSTTTFNSAFMCEGAVSCPTPIPTATATPTVTPTATPIPTATPTVTPTATPIPTATATPTVTPTATPIPTATATPTVTPTATPIPTATATPSTTPTPTPTAAPTRPERVTVCHRGKSSISVSANAVPAHLAHGDTLGACP